MPLLALAASIILPLAIAAVVVLLVFGGAAAIVLGLEALGQFGDTPSLAEMEPGAQMPPPRARDGLDPAVRGPGMAGRRARASRRAAPSPNEDDPGAATEAYARPGSRHPTRSRHRRITSDDRTDEAGAPADGRPSPTRQPRPPTTPPGRSSRRPAPPGRPGPGSTRPSAPRPARPPASASRGPATPPSSRRPGRDPIAILAAQEEDRLPDLVPLRHERMAESPFAYYRGTPAVMAFDLAATPRTDILVQASGDAHLSNFGLFASPGADPRLRRQRLRRDAAGAVGVGRQAPRRERRHRRPGQRLLARPRAARRRWPRCAATASGWPATRACASSTSGTRRSPRPTSARRARRRACSRAASGPARRARLEAVFTKARRRDGMRAFESLTGVVDGRRVILEDPPVIMHVEVAGRCGRAREGLHRLPGHDAREPARLPRALPLRRLRPQGGRRGQRRDPLLRVRPPGPRRERPAHPAGQGGNGLGHGAATSPPSGHASHAQRVVVGQQLMQATSDIFLGWTRGPGGRDFYLRQLWDMKGSVDTTILQPPGHGVLRRASAAGRLRGPTPGRATRPRSPPTWGRATRSTRRSPTSRRPTPTSTPGTTRPTSRRSRPGESRRRRAEAGRRATHPTTDAAHDRRHARPA